MNGYFLLIIPGGCEVELKMIVRKKKSRSELIVWNYLKKGLVNSILRETYKRPLIAGIMQNRLGKQK